MKFGFQGYSELTSNPFENQENLTENVKKDENVNNLLFRTCVLFNSQYSKLGTNVQI